MWRLLAEVREPAGIIGKGVAQIEALAQGQGMVVQRRPDSGMVAARGLGNDGQHGMKVI